MHRQFSLQPFSRHYSHSTNPFLDFLDIQAGSKSGNGEETSPIIGVTASENTKLLDVLTTYKTVQNEGRLHTLTFVTVNDYLWLLRAVSQELSKMKRKALYYLAAAVSDFFLPRRRMAEHKIQSGKGSLLIEMDQVPKILKPMVDEWSKDGYIVSFKVRITPALRILALTPVLSPQLETDPALLIPKARAALERYGHQVVIGNDLHRRKFEVVFVSKPSTPTQLPGEGDEVRTSDEPTEVWLKLDPQVIDQGKEIEEDIIAELVKRHQRWIKEGIEN
ncbi:Phosphopantothenate--cysteine ligase cab2 [Marasmius tenuissimus]|uniref:Phosphopantothenate--cysteine ligase cab2 n=1 Tax=Marasmius tenuissimus TaxID=585030 RepID=A0ABR3A3M1_9AGAR